jgi:hypothetical protein
MKKSRDEKTIETMTTEILQNNNAAMAVFLYALACPQNFKDEYEWSFALGRLFSMAIETEFHKKNAELLYDGAGEAVVDDQINQLLGRFNAREKVSIFAFLLAASRPTTQTDIDSMAGQECLRQIVIH